MRPLENQNVLQAQEIQRAILGAGLLNPVVLRGLDLPASDFVGSVDRLIYTQVLQSAENGEPLDALAIAQTLQHDGGVENGAAYIGRLIDSAVSNDPRVSRRHAESLQRLSQLRRLGILCEKTAHRAGKVDADPVKLADEIEGAVRSLRTGRDFDGKSLSSRLPNLPRRPDILPLSQVEAREVPWLWRPFSRWECWQCSVATRVPEKRSLP